MSVRLSLAALLCGVTGLVSHPYSNIWQADPGDRAIQLTVGGVARTYWIHVPKGGAPPAGFPLIFAFHGGGGGAVGMIRLTNFDKLADARKFIVVYPDGIDHHWNDGRSTIKNKTEDVRFVNAIIDDVDRQYSIDGKRVFATGISNGALFSHRLACELSARISAIAPVAGPMPSDLEHTCRPEHLVSVLQIEGTGDPIIPYNGGAVADFGGRGEGGDVLSTEKTISFWSNADRCGKASSPESLPLRGKADGTHVTRVRYADCSLGVDVVLLTVDGGGHAWPGGAQYAPRFIIGTASDQLDASAAIVDFFLAVAPRGAR